MIRTGLRIPIIWNTRQGIGSVPRVIKILDVSTSPLASGSGLRANQPFRGVIVFKFLPLGKGKQVSERCDIANSQLAYMGFPLIMEGV